MHYIAISIVLIVLFGLVYVSIQGPQPPEDMGGGWV